MKLKKNDTVKILSGKDKGKIGKVLKISPNQGRVLVENINLFKKHVRPKKQGEEGQIIEMSRPIHEAKVALFCSSCGRAARIGYKIEGKTKSRICKKCQVNI